MLATIMMQKPRLRDVLVIQDQGRHTTVGGVSRSSSLGSGLLGRAGNLLGRHD
jgi:hypothetical protein